MTVESPEQLKARKLAQLEALIEAIAAEQNALSRAFFHGWIMSAAMELWDRGVLSQEERLAMEVRVKDILTGEAAE